jgi:penicillin-binding protein 1A
VGSTFKPLLYTLAVKDAGYTPETMVEGGTIVLGGKAITGGGGTLAYCLAHSKNAAAYRLMSIIGPAKTVEFAHACGIKADIPQVPSIALGSAEIPILELLQSYTMFPNKGLNTSPVFISRIEDKNGNLLESFQSETKQLIAETDAYTMVKLMKGVVEFGTGKSLGGYGIPVQKAGKTGTTNSNADGWFMGYTPELLAGTWVGCDENFIRIYTGTSGGNELALPNWGYFMKKVYADKKLPYGKLKEFDKPATTENDVINGDAIPQSVFMQGDNIPDEIGNGDDSDFIKEPSVEYKDNTIDPAMVTDTSKQNEKPKPVDKKETQPATTPGNKPAEDKTKKPAKPNDY